MYRIKVAFLVRLSALVAHYEGRVLWEEEGLDRGLSLSLSPLTPLSPQPSQSRHWHIVADVIKWETTPHIVSI